MPAACVSETGQACTHSLHRQVCAAMACNREEFTDEKCTCVCALYSLKTQRAKFDSWFPFPSNSQSQERLHAEVNWEVARKQIYGLTKDQSKSPKPALYPIHTHTNAYMHVHTDLRHTLLRWFHSVVSVCLPLWLCFIFPFFPHEVSQQPQKHSTDCLNN